MVKATVYLPDEVKVALGREAARTNTSEAELIRAAITRLLGITTRPRPRFGMYHGESLTVEERDESLADGFGERCYRIVRPLWGDAFTLLPADTNGS